jgi:hypothetical protein
MRAFPPLPLQSEQSRRKVVIGLSRRADIGWCRIFLPEAIHGKRAQWLPQRKEGFRWNYGSPLTLLLRIGCGGQI